MVCCHGRSLVHRPSLSGSSWRCQGPSAPWHGRGVPSHVMVAGPRSGGMPPPAALLWAHASVRHPPAASGVPADHGAGQGAVSPCGEADLPAVVSASLSLRAWPPPPAAPEVHRPVASLTTAAFPSCGPGRRSPMSRTATAGRRALRGCSHALMFRPAGVLATPSAPPATAATGGPPGLFPPSLSWVVTSPCPG